MIDTTQTRTVENGAAIACIVEKRDEDGNLVKTIDAADEDEANVLSDAISMVGGYTSTIRRLDRDDGDAEPEIAIDFRERLDAGDHVRVHIESTAPTGFMSSSKTEFDNAVVETVDEHEIVGTDPNWGDTVRVRHDGETFRMNSGGKEGEVVRIEVFETTDDGVPIHGRETVVYESEEDA